MKFYIGHNSPSGKKGFTVTPEHKCVHVHAKCYPTIEAAKAAALKKGATEIILPKVE